MFGLRAWPIPVACVRVQTATSAGSLPGVVVQLERAGFAGPTQPFRFEAVRRGTAVIRFLHTGQSPAVETTVRVH